MTRRLIAFDPGTVLMGYGVLEDGPRYIGCGVLTAPEAWPRWRRLQELHADLTTLLDEFKPTHAAIEGGIDRFASPALAGGEARGIILAALYAAGISHDRITEHSNTAVKRALTGYGKSGKEAIARVVQLRLKMQSTPSFDAADALAVGICGLAGACRTLAKRRPKKKARANVPM